MSDKPGIYVLRAGTEAFPKREGLSAGDIVIMKSGDVAVWVGEMWDLLPGRYLDIEQLKSFLCYVATGWPSSADEAEVDLKDKVTELFLQRFLSTVSKLASTGHFDSVPSLDQSIS